MKADGVTNDSRNLQTAIEWAATNNARLVLPAGSINLGANSLVIRAGSSVSIEGAEPTSLVYTGSGTALTVGDSTKNTDSFALKNVVVDISGAAPGANGIVLTRVLGGHLKNVLITGLDPVGVSGRGIQLDGTGYFTGLVEFDDVTVSGCFTEGILVDGPTTNTANAFVFTNIKIYRDTTNCRQPGTTSIGFHWGYGAGDGWILTADCDSYDVCYQIDGNYLRGDIRGERNSVVVNYGPLSSYNHLRLSSFDNVQDNITAWEAKQKYPKNYHVFNGKPMKIYRAKGDCTSGSSGGPTCSVGSTCDRDGNCSWASTAFAGPPPWSAGACAVGRMVSNAGNAYRCTAVGAVCKSPPTGTGSDITPDGKSGAHWSYFGAVLDSPPILGVGNALVHFADFIANNTPGGSHIGETRLQNQGDGEFWLSLNAGREANQSVAIHFEDRGSVVGRVWKDAASSNRLTIDDGTNPKILLNPGPAGSTQIANALQQSRVTLTYGKRIALDAAQGNEFVVTVTDAAPFSFAAPANPRDGQRISVRIRNTTRGPINSADPFPPATYKHAAWAQPASGYSRAIDFQYDGSYWIEVSRTPADVPN